MKGLLWEKPQFSRFRSLCSKPSSGLCSWLIPFFLLLVPQSQAKAIVEELFPSSAPTPMETGSPIDVAVAKLSQEVVDDFPASDPRWAESVPQGEPGRRALLHSSSDMAMIPGHGKTSGYWPYHRSYVSCCHPVENLSNPVMYRRLVGTPSRLSSQYHRFKSTRQPCLAR